MTAAILNDLLGAYLAALQSGQQALAQYSIPLLGACALLAFYLHMGPLVAFSQGGNVGEALAEALMIVLKLGIFHWLLLNFAPLATAFYETFLQWGMTPAGSGVTARTFLQPGAVVDAGFVVASGLYDMANRLSVWGRATQPFLVFGYSIGYWAVIIGFSAAALHLVITMIEYHLSVLVATVLVPWGVLAPTAFFSEFSIGWVTGGLVRVLVSAAVVGIGYPLFQRYSALPSDGGDPTTYSATILALASLFFGLLAWTVPGRAASIAGRGISLALHGGTVMAGAAGGLRTVLLVTQGVRGLSTMVRGMR